MKKHDRVINTGLTGQVNKDILDSVIGQLSDGMWENTPMMRKYWEHADIGEQDGNIVIFISDGFGSGFRGKDDAAVKAWFADKVKHIAKEEIGDGSIYRPAGTPTNSWSRQNKTKLDYLSRGEGHDVTVEDAYKAYDALKGRSIKPTRYATAPVSTPTEPQAPVPQATPESLVNHLIEAGRKAIVTAQAFNRQTGEPNGVSRDETVDLDTNRLFTHCKSWLDVKRAYESFWNDLNPDSEDVVFVSNVKMPTASAMDKFVQKHAKTPKFPEPAHR